MLSPFCINQPQRDLFVEPAPHASANRPLVIDGNLQKLPRASGCVWVPHVWPTNGRFPYSKTVVPTPAWLMRDSMRPAVPRAQPVLGGE